MSPVLQPAITLMRSKMNIFFITGPSDQGCQQKTGSQETENKRNEQLNTETKKAQRATVNHIKRCFLSLFYVTLLFFLLEGVTYVASKSIMVL